MPHVVGTEEDLDKFEDFVVAKMLDAEFTVDGVLESDICDVLEVLDDDVIEERP
jgi:hypothetical protein